MALGVAELHARRAMRYVVVVVAVALAGCGEQNPNCKPAVDHVFAITVRGPNQELPAPRADEQAIIDQIKRQALDRCNRDGLSVEQRDCILAAKSLNDRAFLTCPALVAKPPGWIIAPIGNPDLIPSEPR